MATISMTIPQMITSGAATSLRKSNIAQLKLSGSTVPPPIISTKPATIAEIERLVDAAAQAPRAAAQSISTASATDNVYHDDSSALAASTGTHSGAASDTGRVLLGIYSSDVFATEATHTDSGSNHSHLSSAAEFMFG